MGCIQDSQKGSTQTVWACQYCGVNFATYELADLHEKMYCASRPTLTREDSHDVLKTGTNCNSAQSSRTEQAAPLTTSESGGFAAAVTQLEQSASSTLGLIEMLRHWRQVLDPQRLGATQPAVLADTCKTLVAAVSVARPVLDNELAQFTQFLVAWQEGDGTMMHNTFDELSAAESTFAQMGSGRQAVLLMSDAGQELQYAGDRQRFDELRARCLNARTTSEPAPVWGKLSVSPPPGAEPHSIFGVQTPDGRILQLRVPGQIPQEGFWEISYPMPPQPPPGKPACLMATKLLCNILSAVDEATPDPSSKVTVNFKPAADAVCQIHSHVCVRCTVRHAKQAMLFAKQVGVTGLPELDAVCRSLSQVLKFPSWWDLSVMEGLSMDEVKNFKLERRDKTNLFAYLQLEQGDLDRLQKLFDASFVAKYTRDRKGGKVPDRLLVQRAVRVQNAQNWSEFMGRNNEIRADLATLQGWGVSLMCSVEGLKTDVPEFKEDPSYELDRVTNTAWLFHGTSAGEAIATSDFCVDLAGSHAGTLYGRGVYLAESCAKSDEYSSENAEGLRQILVCRATLGSILYCDEVSPNTDELVRQCCSGFPPKFHSVLGDREKTSGTFREFIVYDEDQVYPEFVVWYKRVYN